jgi:hypothetical protein
MTDEKNKKLSALFFDKKHGGKLQKHASALMIGTGMAGIGAAVAGAMTAAITGLPMLNMGHAFNGVFAEKPLSEEQSSELLAQVMDDKLDPRRYDGEQQTAARGHIRANIGDLSHLKHSFLTAVTSRNKNAAEIETRIDAIMTTPDFTQLMNEHSAVWRDRQRVLHGQEVAAALTGSLTQIKAPPRASFTRNRNTVTA